MCTNLSSKFVTPPVYIMLYISLNFIKPDNTYVLIWSFQYGPLEPCWFLKDSESKNIWFMKLIDIVIFWLKIKRRGHIIKEWFLPYISCRLLGSTSSLVESARSDAINAEAVSTRTECSMCSLCKAEMEGKEHSVECNICIYQ